MAAQSPQPMEPDDPAKRRTLKRIGVGAGTVATLGAGSQIVPRYSPIGRAQAIAVTTAAAISLAVGAGAGAGIAAWHINGSTEMDPDDVAQNNIYNAAAAVADGREQFQDQMEAEFLDPSNPQQTPYGRTAWQAIRTGAGEIIVNGGTNAEAEAAAVESFNKATTRAVINMVERWNTMVKALIEQLVLQYEEGLSVIDFDDLEPRAPASGFENVEASIPSSASNGIVHRYTFQSGDLPADPESLEGRDEPLSALVICSNVSTSSGTVTYAPGFNSEGASILPSLQNGAEYTRPDSPVDVTHPDLSTVTLTHTGTYNDIFTTISTAHSEISNQLSTYVQNLYDGIQQGAIDPSNILSANDLVQEFADSEGQARLAAELAAIGAHVPDSAGYRATISHPDLQAESLTGHLFPQFAEGIDPGPIQPGTTIASADYSMAYFGYEEEASGEFETVILSGGSDLQILATEGVDGQEKVDSAGSTAGASGRVVVYSGDSPPDPIATPSDHSGYSVFVRGETTTHAADISTVVQDGSDYVLESTALSDGEAIENVELVPPVNTSRQHDYVADETQIDLEETRAQMQALRQQQDDLEEALNNDGSSGPGPIFPNIGLSGSGGRWLGLGLIGLVVLAVVGFVTDMIPGVGGN